MRSVRSDLLKAGICVVVSGALLFSTGCGSTRPARVGSERPKEKASLSGTAREGGRGVVNVAFCWLAIPYEVEHEIRSNDSSGPFSVISKSFSAGKGIFNGTWMALERAMGGSFEVLFCLTPPYDPMMEPSLPPYLDFEGTEADSEKPEGTEAEGT